MCDRPASHISMMKGLGGNMIFPQPNPFFKHPETNYNIALLLYPCHMLKLIRGALFTYRYTNGDGLIINKIKYILIYNTISNIMGQLISWKYLIYTIGIKRKMENILQIN